METTNWVLGAMREFHLVPVAKRGAEHDPKGRRWEVRREGALIGFLECARRFDGRRFGGVRWRVAYNPTGLPYRALWNCGSVNGYLRRADALGDLYGAACTGDPERWVRPGPHARNGGGA